MLGARFKIDRAEARTVDDDADRGELALGAATASRAGTNAMERATAGCSPCLSPCRKVLVAGNGWNLGSDNPGLESGTPAFVDAETR